MQINKIDDIIMSSGSPLWSDPRNVNTLSYGSLCLKSEPTFHGKTSSHLLTQRKSLQPKPHTLKKVLHKLLNYFTTLNRDKNPSICYNICNKTKNFSKPT